MLVKTGADMLIETRVALDKIESFRNESFEPEEIQLFLNKSQFRLLDDLINRNFQQGTLRYEWLRPFQSSTTGLTPVWNANPDLPATVLYPTDPILYYLVGATGVSTKSGLTPESKFDDGCDQPITDPGTIVNPMTKFVQIDVIETGQAIDRTHNSFYGNNPRSPRSEALADGIRIFRDETFIISDVVFEYIIEPPLIDVSLATVLPWSVSANQKIIDYTVEYMRLTIADPLYQANVNDFNTRTQNA
jgi:hypothetical protein